MLRLIITTTVDSGGGLPLHDYLTKDVNLPLLEAELTRGGRGPDGFHLVRFVGCEQQGAGARFILESAHSQDGYVHTSTFTVDVAGLVVSEGWITGVEVLPGEPREEEYQYR